MLHTQKGRTEDFKKCTLPLTAEKCVSKIITEMGVMEVRETASGLRSRIRITVRTTFRRQPRARCILTRDEGDGGSVEIHEKRASARIEI